MTVPFATLKFTSAGNGYTRFNVDYVVPVARQEQVKVPAGKFVQNPTGKLCVMQLAVSGDAVRARSKTDEGESEQSYPIAPFQQAFLDNPRFSAERVTEAEFDYDEEQLMGVAEPPPVEWEALSAQAKQYLDGRNYPWGNKGNRAIAPCVPIEGRMVVLCPKQECRRLIHEFPLDHPEIFSHQNTNKHGRWQNGYEPPAMGQYIMVPATREQKAAIEWLYQEKKEWGRFAVVPPSYPVMVTNPKDEVIGRDAKGKPVKLERVRGTSARRHLTLMREWMEFWAHNLPETVTNALAARHHMVVRETRRAERPPVPPEGGLTHYELLQKREAAIAAAVREAKIDLTFD